MLQVVGGLTGNQGMKERGQAQESHGDNKQVWFLMVAQPLFCSPGQPDWQLNDVVYISTETSGLCLPFMPLMPSA